jgi:hypothetical protein
VLTNENDDEVDRRMRQDEAGEVFLIGGADDTVPVVEEFIEEKQ